jgi:hypothetical protein
MVLAYSFLLGDWRADPHQSLIDLVGARATREVRRMRMPLVSVQEPCQGVGPQRLFRIKCSRDLPYSVFFIDDSTVLILLPPSCIMQTVFIRKSKQPFLTSLRKLLFPAFRKTAPR